MDDKFSTQSLQKIFVFPFKDPRWFTKALLFFALCIANILVPIIPGILICGYLYHIMRGVIVDGSEPALPEWDDWGELLSKGFRLFAVSFIYSIPALLFGALSIIAYTGTFFAIPIIAEGSQGGEMFPALMLPMMGIFFILMGISMLFSLLELILLPAAVSHVVAKDSFKAGFDLAGWWSIFRANLGGYAVALIVFLGLYTALIFAGYLFYLTLILCCLMYVVFGIGGIYLGVVQSALWAYVYREGVIKLSGE